MSACVLNTTTPNWKPLVFWVSLDIMFFTKFFTLMKLDAPTEWDASMAKKMSALV